MSPTETLREGYSKILDAVDHSAMQPAYREMILRIYKELGYDYAMELARSDLYRHIVATRLGREGQRMANAEYRGELRTRANAIYPYEWQEDDDADRY